MFIAVLLIGISTTFFGIRTLGAFVLAFALLRIITLRDWRVALAAIIAGGGLIALCMLQLTQIDHRRVASLEQTTGVLFIQPDQVNLSGDYLTGQATWNGESVLVSGVVRDVDQLAAIKSATQPLSIEAGGQVSAIEPPTNRNQFDARSYYASRGIVNRFKISGIQSLTLKAPFGWDFVHRLRQVGLHFSAQLPNPLRMYFASLILGQMTGDDYDEIEGIRTLGLIHLFSISGLHVDYFVRLIERILIYLRLKRQHYQLVIMLLLPAYFVFAGASLGLFRAIVMTEIAMLARRMNWQVGPLDCWSLALILNLIVAPQMVVQFGSQLSYALSLGLVFTRTHRFVKQTILMNLVSIPLVLFHTYEWYVLTFLANLLILPLFTIAIFPLVICGALLNHWFPLVGNLVAQGLSWFDVGTNWLGQLPGNVQFGKPQAGLMLLAFGLTLLLLERVNLRIVLGLISCYVVAFTILRFPFDGEISYFDVGQGDSILIREPFNRSVSVIDTGGKLRFGQQQAPLHYQAERTSINYLKSIGVFSIDNLFVTHQDTDHCGDLPAFLSQLRVKNLIIPSGMQNNPNFMKRLAGRMGQTRLVTVTAGMQTADQLIQVLHPFQPGLGTNDDSLLLKTKVAGLAWLFTGDLGQPGEQRVLDKNMDVQSNVLKLGHHGSKNSSSDAFLDLVNPQVAIVSAGRNNRYGHPHAEVMAKLAQRKVVVYNTQVDGMITYRYGVGIKAHFETVLRRTPKN